MEGWIKIHRRMKDHWLWKSERRLKWWLDILLTVNHSDTKVLIKGTLIECKRGQSVRSLETWAKDWNITKGAVRDFFKLLESDQMLHTESLQITTRITVCKYEDYQTEVYAQETQRKRKTNGEETHSIPKQEEEELKNEIIKRKEDDFKLQVSIHSNGYSQEMLNKFINYWTEKNKSGVKMRFELEKVFEISRRLVTWASKDKEFNKTTIDKQNSVFDKYLIKDGK